MRQGKIVDVDNPTYLLDKNKGTFRVPIMGGEYFEVQNLKFKNRDAYDANYFDLKVGGKVYRIQKDELLAGLQYV
jgi:hypothetical protein